ncbi:XdhC family protein [Ideonella livida]|uniref:XdhC family protein n=1 Tax=Ideonella livida TaxID=2707176 RepID=A0A7C9TL46_9BURK|nr:XdhC family protein [Ideonella livida]NDY93141.1 XdhC family protein [Ideonella livida]
MDDLDTRVLRAALAWQQAGTAAVLVTVARTWGSSPRPPGSFMAIDAQGRVVGSVSGGCIEDDLIERIRSQGITAVCAGGRPQVLRYGVSAEQAHRFGLPCGGTVELVLEPVGAHSRLDELLAARQQRQALCRELDLATGAVTLRPATAADAPGWDATTGLDPLPGAPDTRRLLTPFGPPYRLILIGAGDLSRFLCEMALGLGFELIVCDPREEQAQGWSFSGELPGVTLTREMPDDCVQRLRPDARTAVIALTHDPKLDDLALMDALATPAFYVGAIGSRRNSAQRRERLREHFEVPEAALARLRGPAGLYIGSQTPAEIALSILAEVVAAKNGVSFSDQAQVAAAKARREAAAGADAAHAAWLAVAAVPATCGLGAGLGSDR